MKRKNPIHASHGTVPDLYPEGWYMDIGSATDLRKVRDAIRDIDNAQTRPELYAAYSRGCEVARTTPGVSPALRNDIGFSYTERLSEIPPTKEEAEQDARDAGAKATAAWAKSYKYKPSRRRNPVDSKGRFILPLDIHDLNGTALLQILDRLPPSAAKKYRALRETGLNVKSAALNVIVGYEGKKLHSLNAKHIANPTVVVTQKSHKARAQRSWDAFRKANNRGEPYEVVKRLMVEDDALQDALRVPARRKTINPAAKQEFKTAYSAHRAWKTRRIPHEQYDKATRGGLPAAMADITHRAKGWKLDTPKRLTWTKTSKGGFSAYLGSGTSVDVEPNQHLSWGPAGFVAVIDKYSGAVPKFISKTTGRAYYGTVPGSYVFPTAAAAKQAAAKYLVQHGSRDRSITKKLPNPKRKPTERMRLYEAATQLHQEGMASGDAGKVREAVQLWQQGHSAKHRNPHDILASIRRYLAGEAPNVKYLDNGKLRTIKMDSFTAQAILQVGTALENQAAAGSERAAANLEKFKAMPLKLMATIAFKLVRVNNPKVLPALRPVDPALLRQLKGMTSRNHHGEALLFVARSILGSEGLAAKVAAINKQHMRDGYLTHELSTKRYALYQIIMRQLQKRLGEKGYEAVRRCL